MQKMQKMKKIKRGKAGNGGFQVCSDRHPTGKL
jgi:hypothetical protein